MHKENLKLRPHRHTFGQDLKRPGEGRTVIVIILTCLMMLIEIVTGILFGSMALLADGLHMASHAAALGINAFAYIYARRHANDTRFSFGSGKVNALGGFTGALLLAIFALLMAGESLHRILNPVEIVFNQAILVAVLGLLVNGVSVLILGVKDEHDPHGDHGHAHHHDHNLRSAYLHVLADALTSILAIFALLAAKYFGFIWMDPLMGVVGAILVAHWSFGLLRTTADVLLDRQGPEHVRNIIRDSIEKDGDSKVTDLHFWSIGPNINSGVLTVAAHNPATPDQYKARIPQGLGLQHITIEIHRLPSNGVLKGRGSQFSTGEVSPEQGDRHGYDSGTGCKYQG